MKYVQENRLAEKKTYFNLKKCPPTAMYAQSAYHVSAKK